MPQESQEKEVRTFEDLPQARHRAWAAHPETQLFLRYLEDQLVIAEESLEMQLAPSSSDVSEYRIAYHTEARMLRLLAQIVRGADA
jgi:hypothetical protein